MLRKELLQALVRKYQHDIHLQETVPRQMKPKLQKQFATIISGIRRCGKSTLAKQLVTGKKTYYFHFENVQLAGFEQKDFARLDEAFKEELGAGGIYLLDEVQNMQGWEIYVRQLVDEGNIVIVTGSNASMLSKELGTRLTGRNLRYDLYPFSFTEYLHLRKAKRNLQKFNDYFEEGGFAEYLQQLQQDVLRNLFQDIFYRDIVVRNDIRSEPQLEQFVAYISAHIGVEISHNKLKSLLGLGSVNTVSQFVYACEQAYLFFQINRFDYSLKKQQVNPKKMYCVDNGILKLNSFAFSEKKGRYLENTVFMGLKREGKELFFHKKNYECDFLVKEGLKIKEALQVCYELNDENEKRELQGLVEACKEHQLTSGLLLTYNQEDSLEIDGITIAVQPVWKWLN